MGQAAKWEYFRAIYERYRQADRKGKHAILNEFCVNTDYHRKYAIRLLNGAPPGQAAHGAGRTRRRGLSYSREMLSILAAVWEAAGYPWSVRLKALLPLWMPWIRKRFRLGPEITRQLLSISPRQMDRRLRAHKTQQKRRIYGRTKPGLLLKHQIPAKTDSWDVRTPGFTEVDLVSHSGNSTDGEFAHTLNVTDIHTSWTESRAVLGKGQTAVKETLNEVESTLPFRLLGVDPFRLAKVIDQKLERIYKLTNRRLSPKAMKENQIMASQRGKGCGKAASGKSNHRISPALGNPAQPAGFPLSHSHGGAPLLLVTSQMARQPRLRLHS